MCRTTGVDIGTTFITVYEKQGGSVLGKRHEGKITETLHSSGARNYVGK